MPVTKTTTELRNNHFLQRMQGVSCRFLVVVGAAALLSGCAMSGFDLQKAAPDKTAITGSVNKPPVAEITDSSKMSDQNTIRNVVSALNFTQWGKTPIPWANPDTGSQGTITTVAEKKTEAGLCREFETSREAFDGAALYRGQACMAQGGAWALTSFAPL